MTGLSEALVPWYAAHARELPWRAREAGAWAVLVSEVMLQQTPVARVIPVYDVWVRRWPSPGALAAASPGEAVRAWGRLGYPRRALRLHACAVAVEQCHGGVVPAEVADLQALPGIGTYTARAVASFAYGQRHPVVDTNVRRVVARAIDGHAEPGPPSTARDLAAVERLLPDHDAPRFSAALMELGALICTAKRPRCDHCPLVPTCAWRRAGSPPYEGPRRAPQPFAGTDRQARGQLMQVIRDATEPVPSSTLDTVWTDPEQRHRALTSLVTDGLVIQLPTGELTLP